MSMMCWTILRYAITSLLPVEWVQQSKVLNNIVSFTHSVSMSALSFGVLNQYSLTSPHALAIASSGYFAFDSASILVNMDKDSLVYLYHHGVTLYILYGINFGNFQQAYFLAYLFHLGELSNFFNYIVYHCIKNKSLPERSLQLRGLKCVQLAWFMYFRVYLFTVSLYRSFFRYNENDILLDLPYFLQANMIMLYLMGFVWVHGQVRGLFK